MDDDIIDTTNEFAVGVLGNMVAILVPPCGPITRPQARRLAAWLTLLADGDPAAPTMADYLAAIQSS